MVEIAYGVAGKILEKLGSLALREISLALGLQSDLSYLEHTISTIQAVLLDAEEKRATNRRLSLWLGQLKDILYDAEDVLGEIEYKALRKQVVSTYGSTSTKVRDFFSSPKALSSRFKLAHKIKNIRERLAGVAAEKDQFNLTQRPEDGHVVHTRDMTHSFVHPSTVIGRDEDKKKIIDLLMRKDASRNVNVIPIVGLGGLGKTTLAKLVYNDEGVVGHFQLRAWVCVSEDFSLTRLIKEILKSTGFTIDENSSTVDTLQTKLRERLLDNRFLLVLDDVWNEDPNRWNELKDLLIGGSNGSNIVVTTRSNVVASVVGTVAPHKLEGLSQKDCLSLFVNLAFKDGEGKGHPKLVAMGNEIVEKCNGVPLAVRTLGGLLHSKVDECYWKLVRDCEIWKLEQKDGDILPALRLSYDRLPFHLKQCFAYCSLFPKDHEFDNLELIYFWMAHGILQTNTNDNQEPNEVGERYIKELASISFFQDIETSVYLEFDTFTVHDLVHDLALLVAHGECSVVKHHTKDVSRTVRHLTFSQDVQEIPVSLQKLTGVRTVIFPPKTPIYLVEACISRFKYLRVLNLSESSLEALPSSISTLKHLRILDMSWNERLKELPNSICKLHNLQSLYLNGCLELERLPKDVRNMVSLRYLSVTTITNGSLLDNGVYCLNSLRCLTISRCPRLEFLFQGVDGCLTNLQTLFVDSCESLTCLVENGVSCLNSLRLLYISDCPKIESVFRGVNEYLTNLRSLVIDSCKSLTTLLPHIKHITTLEALVIESCEELYLTEGEEDSDVKFSLQAFGFLNLPQLEVLPRWLQGSANTLKLLVIEDCQNFEALPEWLPSLKSIQKLGIRSCPKLSSLPEGMQHLTTLRQLEIRGCDELRWKCRLEDWYKIAHIPKVDLDY